MSLNSLNFKDRYNSRFNELKKDPDAAAKFAMMKKRRIKELEPTIAQATWPSLWYAYHVLKRRFAEGEAAILKDSDAAIQYSFHELKKPWPEAESVIQSNESNWKAYRHRFNF